MRFHAGFSLHRAQALHLLQATSSCCSDYRSVLFPIDRDSPIRKEDDRAW